MYSVLKNKPHTSSNGVIGHGGLGYGYTMKLKIRFIIGALVLLGLVWYTYKQFEMSAINLDNLSSYKAVKEKMRLQELEDRVNINELFHVGKCLFGLAGEKIVEIRRKNNENIGMEHKVKDNSVVTMADLESHQIIVHTLNHRFKTLRVVSEESNTPNNGDEAKFDVEAYSSKCDDYVASFDDDFIETSRVKVFIDPLDATQEYSGWYSNHHPSKLLRALKPLF